MSENIIMNSSGGGVSGTIDANYYKGAGEREGKEREFVAMKTQKDRRYIVRRLTPLECSRLQGFYDWWCDGLVDEKPTDDEISFWKDVFDTYSSITSTKAKSEKQIRKWLAEEPADSSIYKMWGNGVNLPCVDFVMSGIADVLYGDCKYDCV